MNQMTAPWRCREVMGDCTLYLGDCLEVMPTLGKVDVVVADPPYGTTYAGWDSVIDFAQLWTELRRVCRKDAPMVFTSAQPFTSLLIASNPDEFRVEWVWNKVNGSNFANTKRHPMKVHENVLVFCRQGAMPYYPIKTQGKPNHDAGARTNVNKSALRSHIKVRVEGDLSGLKYPKSIQTFPKHSSQSKHHPTEKPVPLCEYFIQTYSVPGATVLDPTMGSASTGVAAVNLGRKFIGIETEAKYFDVACRRIEEAQRQPDMLVNTQRREG